MGQSANHLFTLEIIAAKPFVFTTKMQVNDHSGAPALLSVHATGVITCHIVQQKTARPTEENEDFTPLPNALTKSAATTVPVGGFSNYGHLTSVFLSRNTL